MQLKYLPVKSETIPESGDKDAAGGSGIQLSGHFNISAGTCQLQFE